MTSAIERSSMNAKLWPGGTSTRGGVLPDHSPGAVRREPDHGLPGLGVSAAACIGRD
jgi:hypothetical protein